MRYQSRFLLCSGNVIMPDTVLALALSPLIPEVRTTARVSALGSKTHWAVLNLCFAMSAEVVSVHYLAHFELLGLQSLRGSF